MKRKHLFLTIVGLLAIRVAFPADPLEGERTPAMLMNKLKRFEKGKPDCQQAPFNKPFHESEYETQKKLGGAYVFMRRLGFIDYSEYLYQLAASKKLPDEQKLEGEWLPPVEDLCNNKMQTKRLTYISDEAQYNCAYPLVRLLFVLTASSGATCPLKQIFRRDDLSLAEKLLKLGVDPNYGTPYNGSFFCCISLAQAELLLQHGADVKKQNEKNYCRELISEICTKRICKKKAPLVRFFLSHLGVKASEENEFGKHWFTSLAKGVVGDTHDDDSLRLQNDTIKEAIQVFFDYGFLYDESAIKKAFKEERKSYYDDEDADRCRVSQEFFLTCIKEHEEFQDRGLSIKVEQEQVESSLESGRNGK